MRRWDGQSLITGVDVFQSQTRSRSTCDDAHGASKHAGIRFQSQTRSRSTCDCALPGPAWRPCRVSISDEKPLHMRRRWKAPWSLPEGEFQSQTRSRSTCDEEKPTAGELEVLVSISDEKPLHMQQTHHHHATLPWPGFNLRREAAPHATPDTASLALIVSVFQSQTRSRSTCDTIPCFRHEKGWMSFNLRREAAPHATLMRR